MWWIEVAQGEVSGLNMVVWCCSTWEGIMLGCHWHIPGKPPWLLENSELRRKEDESKLF